MIRFLRTPILIINVPTALDSLRAHPLRSGLTTLGVIIGVAAVILVIAVGEGGKREVLSQIEALGSNLLIVSPGPAHSRGMQTFRTDTLTLADAEAIAREIPEVVAVSPEVIGSAKARVKDKVLSAFVLGTTADFPVARNFRVAEGRFFLPAENGSRRKVCVIGSQAKKKLFGDNLPKKAWLELNGVRYAVIGVFEQKGSLGWFNTDEMIVLPLLTAQTHLLGISHLHGIDIRYDESAKVKALTKKVARLLRRRHHLSPDLPEDELDFHILDQKELLDTFAKVSSTLTTLLVSIASTALVVGGIGIMNIMLVSVAERIPEIGIRKAVGARRIDILMQFLTEAVVLSMLGAALGVGAGFIASEWVSRASEFKAVVVPGAVLLAVGFGIAVGLIFGIYPAWRASRLDPIQALRRE